MNILLNDDFQKRVGFGGVNIPKLKGHVKITLHNPTTGKNQVVEGDNIVTGALADIFARNILGSVEYGSQLPITDWFGGLLMFHDAFPTTVIDGNTVPDPDDYFIQGENVNQLIGHAGDTAPATAAIVNEDLKRGSPSDVVVTGNSLKQTWIFEPRQANGVIESLALTHVDTGNAGLGSTSSAFQAFVPLERLDSLSAITVGLKAANNMMAQYDDNHGIYFHIGESTDFTDMATQFQTDKITVYKKRLPYSKVGLFETLESLSGSDYIESATIQTSVTFYMQPCFYFDQTNKRLWLFTNVTATDRSYSKTTVNYTVLDISDFDNVTEYAHGTIVSDDSDLAIIGVSYETNYLPGSYGGSRMANYGIIIDGNYIYLPVGGDPAIGSNFIFNSNVTGYKKININNQSDQSAITFNEAQEWYTSPIKNGGLIINNGRVVNGDYGYTCGTFLPDITSAGIQICSSWAFNTPDKVSSYCAPLGNGNEGAANRYIFANKMLMTTKFNLSESITKAGTMAMTVEYTLTEV